jgi:two-component system, cell cycle response regulator
MDDLKGTRVLVVDDDRLIREMVCDALREDGCELRSASSGVDALRVLDESSPFDVVITDLSMREMDGLQLLETVKRRFPKLDLIILTGYASLESALQAMRLGAADYLRKPVQPLEVVYAVRQTLLRRRILNENEVLRGCLQTFEASRVLSACLEASDVLPLFVDLLLRTLDRTRAVGHLSLPVHRPGDGVVVQGFPLEAERQLRTQIEEAKIFDPSVLQRAENESLWHTPGMAKQLDELGIPDPHLLELPMLMDGTVAGAVWIFSEGRPFSDEEMRRCEVLLAQAQLALLNAERFHQAREKAFIDDVTDLYNARYLLSALDREVGRAERTGGELSVLFLDLDRFKLVNDSHGHLIGSQVLRELGQALSGCVRSIDTLARYGGDEFTLLLVDTHHAGALDVAERIRALVEQTDFGQGLHLRLTVSVGVATFPRHGRSRESVLEASDKAMYLGKALGRNMVCSADRLSS